MSKAFREGFYEGFTKASFYTVPLALAVALGMWIGNYTHPYEECKRMYSTPDDIIECVWIKENP
jgi:hypothetical protein